MDIPSSAFCILLVLVAALDQSRGAHLLGHGHSHISPGVGIPHYDTEVVNIDHGDHVHQTIRQVPHLYAGNMGIGRHHLGLGGHHLGLGFGGLRHHVGLGRPYFRSPFMRRYGGYRGYRGYGGYDGGFDGHDHNDHMHHLG